MAVYNVNVGVLGHVDSGKTSLVAALSTQLSTAALDKHPQSRERGITLDLGFSSFTVPAPEHIRAAGYDSVQFTLVDCPGHASLIRTIIGGAQIIDLMLLVVDATKGIQPQTAECIVIGEVATDDLVVVLNKTDLLPAEKRERYIRKAQKLVAQTLAATKFAGAPQVAVAARPGAMAAGGPVPAAGEGGGQAVGQGGGASAAAAPAPEGTGALVETLLARVRLRQDAASAAPFLFYVDHCFGIKGQGTVLTGTVVRGSIHAGDMLELPELRQQRKVKSMQVFRRPVQSCGPGDRAGICVTQLSAKLLERGIACAPNSVPTFTSAIAAVEKIRFYGGEVRSRARLHVTAGPSTVMAELLFFGVPDGQGMSQEEALAGLVQQVGCLDLSAAEQQQPGSGSTSSVTARRQPAFDFAREYLYQEELYGIEGRPASTLALPSAACGGGTPQQAAPAGHGDGAGPPAHYGPQWCYLRFSQPVTAPADSLVIGSRLDADVHGSACRLAFYGRLCAVESEAGGTGASITLGTSGNAGGQTSAAAPAAAQQRHAQQQPAVAQQGGEQSQLDALQRRLRLFKLKQRQGSIERVEGDGRTAICRGMFQKETDLSLFVGMEVVAACGARGRIEGGFGKSGKFRVYFPAGIQLAPAVPSAAAEASGGTMGAATAQQQQQRAITLTFKRFLFDANKRRMVQ